VNLIFYFFFVIRCVYVMATMKRSSLIVYYHKIERLAKVDEYNFSHTYSHQNFCNFPNRCNFRFHFECHLPAGSAALKFNLGGKLIITQQCGCSMCMHTYEYISLCIPIEWSVYSFGDRLLGYVSAFRSGH